ncbi:hypothetical protein [Rhizobium sp. BG4]|uniref:hypothetical protein n=1 Tax=Rhizobium sp. BG4 TaxID=2613770 RepID=UPI00193D2768|nr:hypothetical protein [Rhizobium sp. BG4]QRM47487.1 hypothetical protein F2982_29770 [Rhizobium sp. BG4]
MKRAHKNLIVEYKGGNRRSADKPTSIWGNLDLKSISEDVENELHSNMRRPAAEIGARSETQQAPAVERQHSDLPLQVKAVEQGAEPRTELGMRSDISPAIAETKDESVPKSTDAHTVPAAAVAEAATSNLSKSAEKKRPRAQKPKSPTSDPVTTKYKPGSQRHGLKFLSCPPSSPLRKSGPSCSSSKMKTGGCERFLSKNCELKTHFFAAALPDYQE